MAERRGVLVTGIGGNVGQGILRCLRQLPYPLRLIGTDVEKLTAGHHFCDAFHTVPYAREAGFPAAIESICAQEHVQLIIPATDYEAYHLGRLRDHLPPVLASEPAVTHMCLDKQLTFERFLAHGIPFANSALPSRYAGQWKEVVVKPREGRGSRGLHVNPPDCRAFDDSYVVQQRLIGPEITTAFYVTRDRKLHGEITFERSLENGMTSKATVVLDHEAKVGALLAQIVQAFPIRGPCNVQAMMTEAGPIPFELNCRYSGTNSIRSQLGFEDVRYGIEEYLLGVPPSSPQIILGSAIRVYLDIVYPNRTPDQIAPGADHSYIF